MSSGEMADGGGSGAGSAGMIRVLLVDDQTLVRQGVRSLLEVAQDIEVIAEAEDGMAALVQIDEHHPDVVLLDLRMPRHDGLWTLRAMRERGIEVPVLVLTTFDDDELVLAALRAGARGYLLKDVTLEQLATAVRTLAADGTLVQPSVTESLLRAVRNGVTPDDKAAVVAELTERELEVLRLMAEGYTNRQIAEVLFLAQGTVKNHVSAVLLKMDTTDRTKAVLRALNRGILR